MGWHNDTVLKGRAGVIAAGLDRAHLLSGFLFPPGALALAVTLTATGTRLTGATRRVRDVCPSWVPSLRVRRSDKWISCPIYCSTVWLRARVVHETPASAGNVEGKRVYQPAALASSRTLGGSVSRTAT